MRPSVTALFHSQKALFEEGVFTSVSRGTGPAFAEAAGFAFAAPALGVSEARAAVLPPAKRGRDTPPVFLRGD